jgi:hypothetical protein
MPLSAYYKSPIDAFLRSPEALIIGELSQASRKHQSDITSQQGYAWDDTIRILKDALTDLEGTIYLEFAIPRMGTRADALILVGGHLVIIEFKVGATEHHRSDIEQVWDYALDLKNFHKTSHDRTIIPILCSTFAKDSFPTLILLNDDNDGVVRPICTNASGLKSTIESVLNSFSSDSISDVTWEQGSYMPTPTIIEAASALYNNHSVSDITRSDAGALNLTTTSKRVQAVIEQSRLNQNKSIVFVTGVPGAGKTLVGLNIATSNIDQTSKTHSVFLSGNGPLVAILREALTIDFIKRNKKSGKRLLKKDAERPVKSFVQNVHHYRDEYIRDLTAPADHVAIFDEAQRAWNHEMTSDFMKRKKGQKNFDQSEPQFLISCLDRHSDWGVIVCLVGGGQEINRGEAGISEWLHAIRRHYPHWHVHISDRLRDTEYAAGHALDLLNDHANLHIHPELHLSVSMRSFRAEHVSQFVKELLDLKTNEAKSILAQISKEYPIVLTRDIDKAKQWLKSKARGSERYGLIASSQAERLRPLAIDVKRDVNPVHWFLKGKDDVRSSYYLEDTVTEFQVQGLEVDWACVTWDADMRYSKQGWHHTQFKGSKWQNINKVESQLYQKNAYRVLLTRARQGMVIVVPEGNKEDHTRKPMFYDPTYEYLKSLGIQILD